MQDKYLLLIIGTLDCCMTSIPLDLDTYAWTVWSASSLAFPIPCCLPATAQTPLQPAEHGGMAGARELLAAAANIIVGSAEEKRHRLQYEKQLSLCRVGWHVCDPQVIVERTEH